MHILARQPIPKGMHLAWSKHMVKTQRRIVRLHARIANIRADALHQLTTDLVERFDVIAIEDLNVAETRKNHRLARAIADMGFGEFRRQLQSKAAQRGKTVVVVNRWYPSSKICSGVDTKCRKCRSRCGSGRVRSVRPIMTATSTRRPIYA